MSFLSQVVNHMWRNVMSPEASPLGSGSCPLCLVIVTEIEPLLSTVAVVCLFGFLRPGLVLIAQKQFDDGLGQLLVAWFQQSPVL